MANNHEKRIGKIAVLGDIGTGKTELVKALEGQLPFSSQYKSTIGLDFAIASSDNTKLQLWDITGQERYGKLLNVYLKGAVALVICYDRSRPTTSTSLSKDANGYYNKALEHRTQAGKNIPIILVACKSDLEVSDESKAETIKTVQELHEVTACFDVSSKDGTGIDALKAKLVEIVRGEVLQPATAPASEAALFPIKAKKSDGAGCSSRVGCGTRAGPDDGGPKKGCSIQ